MSDETRDDEREGAGAKKDGSRGVTAGSDSGASKSGANSGGASATTKASAKASTKVTPSAPVSTPVTAMQWVFLAVVALGTAALDLGTKAWAIRRLSTPSAMTVPVCTPPPGARHYVYQRVPRPDGVTVIRNYLDMRYAENCGGAWGLLHGAREGLRKPFFLLVTLGAVIFIVHLYRTLEQNQRAMRWALPLVLGGAIGNLVDRVRLGYVVDFIDMHWRERYHWPTYNVADIAITAGIILMILEYIIGPKNAAVPRAAPSP